MNADDARQFFFKTFGAEPGSVGSAPGRVNLIGEHTDYNGGQVLPIAIDRRTWVALREAPRGARSKIVSSNRAVAEFDINAIVKAGQWSDYVTGVLAAFQARGLRLPQIEGVVISDLPEGSGLSSSAALEMATAVTLAALLGEDLPLRELALISWRVETRFVGVSCGVMDQFASALCQRRRALHLWCDTLKTQQVTMKEAVLIFDTNLPRSLRGSEFNHRQRECQEALRLLQQRNPQLESLAPATPDEVRAAGLPPLLEKRALHVTEETRRVQRLVEALEATGTVSGELLYQSHESLRTLYECSTAELDWFVARAKQVDGVRGARLTGAGWGGCAIAVGELDALEAAQSRLISDYQKTFGRAPRTWLTHAEAGARVEQEDR